MVDWALKSNYLYLPPRTVQKVWQGIRNWKKMQSQIEETVKARELIARIFAHGSVEKGKRSVVLCVCASNSLDRNDNPPRSSPRADNPGEEGLRHTHYCLLPGMVLAASMARSVIAVVVSLLVVFPTAWCSRLTSSKFTMTKDKQVSSVSRDYI